MKKIITLLFVLLFCSSTAFASIVTETFNNGDILSDWSADRTHPATFEIVNNQLQMGIDGSNLNDDDFHNTQGMRKDIGQSTYLSIDMYIDSQWPANTRYAGIWGIGYSSTFGSLTYPILEYQVNSGVAGVASWDSEHGWATPTSSLFNIDEFNNFKFIITVAGVEYYINDDLVHTDSITQTEYFTNVILNAKNEGNDFVVSYDNLTYGTAPVPEPATMFLFSLGLLGLAGVGRKK